MCIHPSAVVAQFPILQPTLLHNKSQNVQFSYFLDQMRRKLVSNSIHTVDADATQLSSCVASAVCIGNYFLSCRGNCLSSYIICMSLRLSLGLLSKTFSETCLKHISDQKVCRIPIETELPGLRQVPDFSLSNSTNMSPTSRRFAQNLFIQYLVLSRF